MATLLQQNFGLTEEEFEELLENLREGDEELFKKIFLSHFQSCMNYLKQRCSAKHDDAYDSTMETLVRFRARCLSGKVKYGNLRFLYTQMAYQLYIKDNKKLSENNHIMDQTQESKETQMVKEDERIAFNKAWNNLKDNCKKLLTLFYFENNTLANIAAAEHKKPEALRKQKQRCVDQLRLSFQKTFFL